MRFNHSAKARAGIPFSLFLSCVLCGVLSACAEKPARQVEAYGNTMGTTYSVKVVLEAGQGLNLNSDRLKSMADEEFAVVNQQMSTYQADSELSLWNEYEQDDWVAVSTALLNILNLSQSISERSEGFFDVTVMPLVNAWGFGPQRTDGPPDEQVIELARKKVGYQQIELDLNGKLARKPVGVNVDLSAIAKGYGADQLAHRLTMEGYAHFMVEVGGELVLSGHNARRKPWRIGIESPSYNMFEGGEAPAAAVAISNMGMATSGDYRNYYEVDGQRVSHTINPVTGRPISHNLASVTVLAESCAEADGWATALNVMGVEKALATAEKEGIAAYFIVKQNEQFEAVMSSAFEPYLDR